MAALCEQGIDLNSLFAGDTPQGRELPPFFPGPTFWVNAGCACCLRKRFGNAKPAPVSGAKADRQGPPSSRCLQGPCSAAKRLFRHGGLNAFNAGEACACKKNLWARCPVSCRLLLHSRLHSYLEGGRPLWKQSNRQRLRIHIKSTQTLN